MPSPCDRIEQRQRAGMRVFRKCIWTDDGAVGVVPDEAGETFRVAFEPRAGKAIVSGPLEWAGAELDELVVLPPPLGSTVPVTFARYEDHLRPAALGARLPIQERRFCASLLDTKNAACTWTELERAGNWMCGRNAYGEYTCSWASFFGRRGYLLTFRLPGLVWNENLAYASGGRRTLLGVKVTVFLNQRYELDTGDSLPKALRNACDIRIGPVLAWAAPDELWAAAQCHRVRGESVAEVLAQVEKRCGDLAREALPFVKTLAELDGRQRDGQAVGRRDLELVRRKLEAVEPPSACFANQHNWNVNYTGRSAPFVLPSVSLEPVWKERLEAMGAWPR